jgi:hypothetical protein
VGLWALGSHSLFNMTGELSHACSVFSCSHTRDRLLSFSTTTGSSRKGEARAINSGKVIERSLNIVNMHRFISCKFRHFHQCNTDVSLLTFVRAHFLSFIHSQLPSEISQNCDFFLLALASPSAFRSTPLSYYGISESRVDFCSSA